MSVERTNSLQAVIVDDEAKSRSLLEALCDNYCEDLEIVGKAASVPEAIQIIDELNPDLVFLDIRMPVKSGFALIEHYKEKVPFEVVFTTAHDEYALKAFKVSAVGYLLKPIEIDELSKAVEKVRTRSTICENTNRLKILTEAISSGKMDKIALATTDGFTFVKSRDIIRCEAQGNYTYVYLEDDTSLLITKTLKHYEEVLPRVDFFRAHKSHLINLNFVRRFIKGKQGMVEMTDGKFIEVSLRKRESLLEKLSE